jgi:hypothetical protein
MICSSFIPINVRVTSAQDVRSNEVVPANPDVNSTSSCFREVVISAAERLGRPVAKKQRLVTCKTHTGLRKSRQHKVLGAASETASPANKAAGNETEFGTQTNQPQHHDCEPTSRLDQSADLSPDTIRRLEAFRFQPPQEERTQIPEGSLPAQRHPRLDEVASADTIVPKNTDSNRVDESPKSTERLSGNGSVQTTRPLDYDLDQPQIPDDEHLSNTTTEYSSPSPFEMDDVDLDLLQIACQAAEDNNGAHSLDMTEHENDTALPGAPHTPTAGDSDFGSDPFEPDSVNFVDELSPNTPALVNAFSSPSDQPGRLDFSQYENNIEHMPPPPYQTPRKTPPTEPGAHQPNPPDLQSTHQKSPNILSPLHPRPSPFLRAPFPASVPSTSLIPNLHPDRRILTCFRTAEYLRATSSTTTPNLLVELYALITASTRPTTKTATSQTQSQTQTFTLSDPFFPHLPPHLHGASTAPPLHSTTTLWDTDTRPFLAATPQRPILCRAIVRPPRPPPPPPPHPHPHPRSMATIGAAADILSSSSSSSSSFTPGRRSCSGSGHNQKMTEMQMDSSVLTATAGRNERARFGSFPSSPTASPARGCLAAAAAAVAATEVEVLSIWAAGWDDVAYVRGIVGG